MTVAFNSKGMYGWLQIQQDDWFITDQSIVADMLLGFFNNRLLTWPGTAVYMILQYTGIACHVHSCGTL